jgi:hypothetical protein
MILNYAVYYITTDHPIAGCTHNSSNIDKRPLIAALGASTKFNHRFFFIASVFSQQLHKRLDICHGAELVLYHRRVVILVQVRASVQARNFTPQPSFGPATIDRFIRRLQGSGPTFKICTDSILQSAKGSRIARLFGGGFLHCLDATLGRSRFLGHSLR